MNHQVLMYPTEIINVIPLNKTVENYFGLSQSVIEDIFGEPDNVYSLLDLQNLINTNGLIDEDFLCIITEG